MIRVFPVAAEGTPHFSNDYGVPNLRGGGLHQGIDIFADESTPIVAVDDGAVRFAVEGTGGNVFYLHADDGTVYYGAHMLSSEGETGRRAVAGEILGYVGRTGNASVTSPHLHFEVHPNAGGGTVSPFEALSELPPPSVTSSRGAVDQVLAPEASPATGLPPLAVVPGPVPPIPRKQSRSGAGFFVGILAGAFALARARARR
jgi:murein DD-endopeptidase MepM/ murein hydrolase activator NlpD